jgi:hypothetical protein
MRVFFTGVGMTTKDKPGQSYALNTNEPLLKQFSFERLLHNCRSVFVTCLAGTFLAQQQRNLTAGPEATQCHNT